MALAGVELEALVDGSYKCRELQVSRQQCIAT